ncbi:MAG: hypothetical protein Q7R78_00800 [bacterium]|nr:hypothetical protein [bacterium]
MENLIKADIFFFITAIAVVVVTILLVISFYYILKILKNTKDVTDQVKHGSDILSGDLSDLRQNIKAEGVKLKFFTKFFNSIKKLGVNNKKGKN